MTSPDLTAADLTAAEADFDGEFDLDSVLVDGGEHADVVGAGTINASVVRNVDLSGARLGPLTVAGSELRGVDLSNASLQQVVLRRARLMTCRTIGLKLSIDLAMDASIEDCRLDYAILHVHKAKVGLTFKGCTFRETTITGDLSNVRFTDCDFTETEFRATRSAKCDLRGSRLISAKGLLSLRGAMISPEQAVAASNLIAAEAGLIVVGEDDA